MASPAQPSSSQGGSKPTPSKKMSWMHLAWSLGHLVVLMSTIWVFLGLIFFRGRSTTYYIAYAGALLSWSIVVYKSLGVPSLSRAYVQRAVLDENVQYLLVALYWFMNKPIYLSLLPFAVFSTFHSLTFVRTTVLKGPAPGTKKDTAAAQANDLQANLSKAIQTWVKKNYESAMSLVALVEVVVIMGRVTLGAITFQNGFAHPIIFAHFLRLRYYLSPQTRYAFGVVNRYIDQALANPSCPAPVHKGVNVVRDLIIRYSESILSPVAAPQQGAAAAAGGGGARPAAGAVPAR